MIIVAGDHGEEFFERDMCGHQSLYDRNIRPGLIVKPPEGSDLVVPENADLIDVFPTIAHTVDRSVPEQCSGVPWQKKTLTAPRIAERIAPDVYLIAVELDGCKGVFRYDSNHPDRPTAEQRERGPLEVEWFDISEGPFESDTRLDTPTDDELKDQIRQEVDRVLESKPQTAGRGADHKISQGTKERLEQLGYK